MPLVKCPDCEKMVSPRVDKCPFCGCPAKFFEQKEVQEKKKTEPTAPKVSFSFGRHGISYSKDVASFAAYFGAYLQAADIAQKGMSEIYNSVGSIGKALELLPDKANGYIYELIDKGTQLLYSKGVFMTPQNFYEKYHRRYAIDYGRFYDVTLEQYSDILDMKRSLDSYREAVKASRSRWQGGGFGVSGAIKGAATAAALNMGSDFLHAFGDSSREKRDNETIQRKLKELYRQSEGQLCYSIKSCVMGVCYAMCEELKAINFFEKTIRIDRKEAEVIYENTKNYAVDKDEIQKNMIQCIILYPGERKYYEPFKDDIINGNTEVKEFLRFWDIEFLLKDIFEQQEKQVGLRKCQNEFDAFMVEKGIEQIDFENMCVQTVATLLIWLHEYGKGIASTGEYAQKIQGYLTKYKQWFWRADSLEAEKESIIDYFPETIRYEDFYLLCSEMETYLNIDSLEKISTYIPVSSAYDLLSVEKKVLEEGDQVLVFYDTSMMGSGKKAFIITERYVIDMKTHTRILISDVKRVMFDKTQRGDLCIRITDEKNEIKCFCYEIDGANLILEVAYLLYFIKAIFVRYGRNNHLMVSSLELSNEDNRLENPQKAKEYWKYVEDYQNKFGVQLNLDFMEMFRRRFKRCLNGCVDNEDDIICKYDYELDDKAILDRIGNVYGQYVLFSNKFITITDHKLYLNGYKFELNEIKEIIVFHNANNKHCIKVSISLKDSTKIITYEDDGEMTDFELLLYLVDIAIENLIWINPDKAYLWAADEQTTYRECLCEKCGSRKFKEAFSSLLLKCASCGNKKSSDISVMEFKDDFLDGMMELRSYAYVKAPMFKDLKELLADEREFAKWIRYFNNNA